MTGAPSHPQGTAERRRRRRQWLLAAIPVAALLVVLSAKAFDGDNPCDAPRSAPSAETALLPAGLSFEQIGPVTRVRKDERYVTVQAVTTNPPQEAAVLIQDAVTAAGYRPAGIESEGVEAVVFFTTGSYAAGQARVRPTACEGRWDIELVLLDREALGTTEP